MINLPSGERFDFGLPGYLEAGILNLLGALNVASAPSPTIAWYGDSLIEQGSSYTTPTVVQAYTQGAALWVKGTELLCPAGAGSLTFDAVTDTLTWAAFGELAGAAVDASKTGLIYVPSSVANHGIYLDWFGGSRTYTTGVMSVTAKAIGFNALDYRTNGLVCTAMAFAQQLPTMAYYNASQNGNEAVYGLGGATSQELVDAAWQFGTISSSIAVLCIGQNDAPAGLSATQTINAIRSLTDAINSNYLVICTLPPRNADTTAQKKAKQQVNHWIHQLCRASSRFVAFDFFSYIADPATGDYVSLSTADSVHTNGMGATIAGRALGALLLTLVPNKGSRNQRRSYLGQYDVTSNPYGDSFATAGMGIFEGSGGTANAGASGTIPAGYKMARTTGAAMTAVGSKVAFTDKPGSGYRVTLASAAASEIVTLEPISTLSAGLTPGTKVDSYLIVNVVSSSGLEVLAISLYDNGSTTQVRAFHNFAGRIADFTGLICIKLPSWTLPSNSAALTAQIKIGTASGGSAVIEFQDYYVGPARLDIPVVN